MIKQKQKKSNIKKDLHFSLFVFLCIYSILYYKLDVDSIPN